jgi:uncharacterized damage-inducible protein DinB
MNAEGAERVWPPLVADEREMLESWLDFHRATLLMKCTGLPADQLASRPVPPSTLSLLGLVRHMSDVESHWFARVLLGERVKNRYWTADDQDADFNGAEPAGAEAAMVAFGEDCRRSRRILGTVSSLDQMGAGQWHGSTVSLRWILVHMIEEYARHNGHADLLRQCLDGAAGV